MAAAALLLVLATTGPQAVAQQRTLAPEEVRAELISRLPGYITWPPRPASDGSATVVSVLGEDPFGRVLDDTLLTPSQRSRDWEIRRYPDTSQLPAEEAPHIVYISRDQRDEYARLISVYASSPVLLVGEEAEFLESGGHLALVARDRLRVLLALDRATESGFRFQGLFLQYVDIWDGTVPARDGDEGAAHTGEVRR